MIGQLIGVIIGALQSVIMHVVLGQVLAGSGAALVSFSGLAVSTQNIIIIAISILEIMFGGKINSIVRTIGYGSIATEIGTMMNPVIVGLAA